MPHLNSKKKDPTDPSTTSFEYDIMIHAWDKIAHLLGGTEAMREAGARYLPPHAQESDANYAERLFVNILFNAFELTVNGFVGRPFSDPVRFNENVPDEIKEDGKNIDLQGNDITAFCREWFFEAISKGFAHVLIDMPSLDEESRPVRTLEDDNQEGRRPYWQLIKPENMIFAEAEVVVDPVTGESREHYTHVRLREDVVERVGFAQVVKHRIRVIEPGFFQVWELRKVKNKKDEWVLIEEGFTGIEFVPIVTYYASRESFLVAKPPLEDLADMNIRHWQSMSDQINILTVARFPMLAVAGATDQSGSAGRIGPRQLLMTKDANGRFYYVEHDGAAIDAGWKELENLEESMEAYGASFLKKDPGNVTATGRALDSAEAVTPLQDLTQRFQDSVDNALAVHAHWLDLEDGGTVTITTDFGPEEVTAEDASLLQDLRKGRDISRVAMINECKRRGTINEEYDQEEDLKQIIKEDAILKPFQPQVPGTFDVKDPDGDGRPGVTRPTDAELEDDDEEEEEENE